MAVGMTTRRSKQRNGNALTSYLLVLPYAILLILFGVGPALYAIALSFSDPFSNTFRLNGLTNYFVVFSDFRFWPAFLNIFVYLIVWLPITIVGVLFLALLLHAHPGRFSTTMRLIYYLPGAITGSAAALLWIFMLDPVVSPFGPIFHLFGVQSLLNVVSGLALAPALAFMAFSIGAGGWIIIMYGAFQNIPQDLIDAAHIDGCNALQTALRIKIPLISKYVAYMIILSFAAGTQLFVEPQMIGQAVGTSTGLVSPTWSPNLLAYDFGFNIGNLSAASAISVILLILGLIVAFILIYKTHFFEIK